MRRFSVRAGRTLLLAVVLTVAVALPGGTAHAASTAQAVTAAASSSPCSFDPVTSCQSTDATVTVSSQFSGASACTFTWYVDWADGSSSNVTVTNPADGYALLAQHTYAQAGVYHITATGQVMAGDCTTTTGNYYFTLLKPTPVHSAPGEACVFNAPPGGISITVPHTHVHLFVSGHVGWAYLANPETGTWVFGANEGPVHIYGGSSLTWIGSGTWSYVISIFKNALGAPGKSKTYFHPGNYYTSYRCATVQTYHSAAALKIAKSQGGESYTIPLSDCLAQTTDVLATYGAPINDSTYLLFYPEWVPNTYYHSVYLKKFGSAKQI